MRLPCLTRAQEVRQELYDELTKLSADRDFSFLLRQVGMFSFTGLSPAQVRGAAAHLPKHRNTLPTWQAGMPVFTSGASR